MKFHCFHLMPYPHLPDDFKERYRSVWVDPPAAELYDPVKGHHVYNDYLDELEYAEQVGFDGICVNEHHQNAYGLMPSPNLMAAALARRTSKAKLVVLGNSVALYNPPIRVAEEMAMLDVHVGRPPGGRLPGRHADGHELSATAPAGDLAREVPRGHELICGPGRSAGRSPSTASTRSCATSIVAAPVQKPHPPVWIPGGGSIETWEWCIANDFLYAYLSYFGYMAGTEMMDGYWETVERLGVEPNPYRAGFLQFVGVAENDAQAEQHYAGPAQYFYNRCFHIDPGYAAPPGYASIASIRKGVRSQVRQSASEVQGKLLTWSDILDRGCVIAGSSLDHRRPAQRHGRPHEGRPRDAAAPLRQHAARDRALQHHPFRARGDAEAAPPFRRMGGQVVAEGYPRRDPQAGAGRHRRGVEIAHAAQRDDRAPRRPHGRGAPRG